MIPVVRTWLWFIHTHTKFVLVTPSPQPPSCSFSSACPLGVVVAQSGTLPSNPPFGSVSSPVTSPPPDSHAVSLHYLGLAVTFGKRSNNFIGLCDHPRKPAAPVICPGPLSCPVLRKFWPGTSSIGKRKDSVVTPRVQGTEVLRAWSAQQSDPGVPPGVGGEAEFGAPPLLPPNRNSPPGAARVASQLSLFSV